MTSLYYFLQLYMNLQLSKKRYYNSIKKYNEPKNRHMDQRYRIERPEMNPHIYGQLIFNTGARIYNGGNSLFSKWCWESWTAACISMKLEHTFTLYTKINSKWLKDLNIRQDTIKLLKKSVCRTFSDINYTNVFLGQYTKETEIKAKTNKWDLIKLTSFCTAKETINKRKRNLQNGRKYLQIM